ncbi:GNAT family N-acetyltransferase [Marinobacter nauticus]|uniref:GNAT family N-acetyltransferase n=1 Tax=Marinobacter nauticus TaxID=2743 RepID=UPI001CF78E3C
METSRSLGYPGRGITDVESDLAELIRSERDRLWVFTVDAAVVGWLHAYLSIRAASTAFVEICGMAVHPEHQRQGIGAALTSHASNWAAEKGLKLRVRCSSVREDTHEFYRKQGFSTVKTQLVFDKNL